MSSNRLDAARRVVIPGHRLDIVPVPGGLQAGCACGQGYHAADRRETWATYERPHIKAAHDAHKQQVRAGGQR